MNLDKTFFEINGLDNFVKVKANAFGINKVLLSFVNFDKVSKKLIRNIDIYMNIPDALLLANDILSGRIFKLAMKEKEQGNKYSQAIWKSSLGGSSEKNAKREDGKAISRFWDIKPGAKKPFILTAYQGAGHTIDTGIIVPDGKPEFFIMVPCNNEDLKKLALMIQCEVQGYITATYLASDNNHQNNN